VIEDEAVTRTVVPFTAEELVIGRASEGVGWRLPDRNVSRRHARFTRASGAIFIEDLGSLTGTRLNGERITSRRRLRPGDLVEIGAFDLVVMPEDQAGSGPDAPPPLPAQTRPEPMPAVLPLARRPSSGEGAAAAAGGAGRGRPAAAPSPNSPRRAALLRLGVASLVGGVLLGFLLRRWLS
jgi:predicted component of type VI protein secretion system